MDEQYVIELEPEVRDWLELLPFRLYRRVEDKADRLLAEPTTLGEPYSRHLGGKLRELRMTLDGDAVRDSLLACPGAADRTVDGIPQDPDARSC